ncbi:MAG: hypothetical protein AAF959_18605, partial [Cyanobacteria bacterium P01_D01_bin.56]
MQKRLRAGTLALFLMVTTVAYGCQEINQDAIDQQDLQASCPVDDIYMTGRGHAQGARSRATLNTAFKAMADNDY